MESPLIVDIETTGTPFDGACLTLGWQVLGEERAHVVDFDKLPQSVFDMMADPTRPFVSHTKYDARFLRLLGVPVTGPFHDTQVMAWVLNENQSLALDPLARRYCGIEMDKRIRIRDGDVYFECDDGNIVPIEDAPRDQLWAYNARDVEATAQLYEDLYERLLDQDWFSYWLDEEVPFTGVLLDMECRGLPIDLERVAVFADEMEGEHLRLLGALHADGGLPPGFNVNSNDQLASYLFSKVFELSDELDLGVEVCECLKSCIAGEHEDCDLDGDFVSGEPVHIVDLLPPGFSVRKVGRSIVHGQWTLKGRGLRPGVKTDSGKWSVSRPALKVNLSTASDPWVQDLLHYKQVDKLLTTYLRRFPERAHEGRIYGRFNQTGTKTGRLSSSEPNLQNIPTRGDLGARTRDLFRVAA